MISPGLNPLPLQRCPPGRAYSTCAYALSGPAEIPIRTPDYLPQSPFLTLPTSLRLPLHPRRGIYNPALVFPEPHTTTPETKQNPLQVGVRAKV